MLFQRPERASFISTGNSTLQLKGKEVFQRPERASFISTGGKVYYEDQQQLGFQRPERASFISTTTL